MDSEPIVDSPYQVPTCFLSGAGHDLIKLRRYHGVHPFQFNTAPTRQDVNRISLTDIAGIIPADARVFGEVTPPGLEPSSLG